MSQERGANVLPRGGTVGYQQLFAVGQSLELVPSVALETRGDVVAPIIRLTFSVVGATPPGSEAAAGDRPVIARIAQSIGNARHVWSCDVHEGTELVLAASTISVTIAIPDLDTNQIAGLAANVACSIAYDEGGPATPPTLTEILPLTVPAAGLIAELVVPPRARGLRYYAADLARYGGTLSAVLQAGSGPGGPAPQARIIGGRVLVNDNELRCPGGTRFVRLLSTAANEQGTIVWSLT